jgi:TolB-like protein
MGSRATGESFLFEGFRLERHGLFRRDERGVFVPIAMGSRAFDVLRVLITAQGDLLAKDEIMAAVWPGTVVEDNNLTVQISALRRILDAAQSGQSCIQTVVGRGYRFVATVTHGEDDLGANTATISAGGPRLPEPLSIAVLPFANFSGDPEQEVFVDAVTEHLTTDLSRMSGSFVIARSTAATYKNKPVDVKRIGSELGVRYVLEGSVRRAGDQLRVNVQLLDAENGAHLWADRFDTNRGNFEEAQNEITGRFARTLKRELVEAATRRIENERAVDPDARDLVMRGWALHYRPYSAMTREEALRAHERALKIDPESVDARIGIAAILAGNLANGWSNSFEQDLARSEHLLLEALERDANRAWMHTTMGLVRRLQNRLPESRTECEAAIALDRNYASAYRQLGITLMCLGHPDTAIPPLEKAIVLNPHDRNTAVSYWALGQCHLFLGHTDQAMELFRKACAGNPWLYYTHLALAAALGLKGELDEAGTLLAEGIRLKPEVNSLARLRAYPPYNNNLPKGALREETVEAGLRNAGMLED